VHFCEFSRGINIIVHHGHHPPVPGSRMGCQAHGIEQVDGAVSAQCICRPHGSCEHHRIIMAKYQVQEEGCLFHGVGAMSYNYTVANVVFE